MPDPRSVEDRLVGLETRAKMLEDHRDYMKTRILEIVETAVREWLNKPIGLAREVLYKREEEREERIAALEKQVKNDGIAMESHVALLQAYRKRVDELVTQDFTASMLQLNERVTKIERVSHDHIFTENRLTYPERE